MYFEAGSGGGEVAAVAAAVFVALLVGCGRVESRQCPEVGDLAVAVKLAGGLPGRSPRRVRLRVDVVGAEVVAVLRVALEHCAGVVGAMPLDKIETSFSVPLTSITLSTL